MKYTIEPWNVTGMSKHGPWIKVRGNQIGKQFKVANVPFTATGDKFYDIEEAEEYARLISFSPTMYELMKKIANSNFSVGDNTIKNEARAICRELEKYDKLVNK